MMEKLKNGGIYSRILNGLVFIYLLPVCLIGWQIGRPTLLLFTYAFIGSTPRRLADRSAHSAQSNLLTVAISSVSPYYFAVTRQLSNCIACEY